MAYNKSNKAIKGVDDGESILTSKPTQEQNGRVILDFLLSFHALVRNSFLLRIHTILFGTEPGRKLGLFVAANVVVYIRRGVGCFPSSAGTGSFL